MSVLRTVSQRSGDGEDLETGMLAGIGLSQLQERVYVLLLEYPSATIPEISRTLGLSRGSTEQTVAALASKGLVTEEAGPTPNWRAVAPDVAIEALVAQQQEELARARLAASAFRERARQAAAQRHDQVADGVESVAGSTAVAQRLWQLQVAAEQEVLAVGLPVIGWWAADEHDPVELSCLRREVSYRALYARDALAAPNAAEAIRSRVEAGAEARVAEPSVELLLVDGRVAALPRFGDDEPASAVVVRSEPLVSAMAALAEAAWADATPLVFTVEGTVVPDDGVQEDIVYLIALLAAGCKDETVARQLGVSTRTLDRRVRVLMDELSAVTRFQAG